MHYLKKENPRSVFCVQENEEFSKSTHVQRFEKLMIKLRTMYRRLKNDDFDLLNQVEEVKESKEHMDTDFLGFTRTFLLQYESEKVNRN